MSVADIKMLRVAELRAALAAVGLQTAGLKLALQERLANHYGHDFHAAAVSGDGGADNCRPDGREALRGMGGPRVAVAPRHEVVGEKGAEGPGGVPQMDLTHTAADAKS